MSTLLLTACWLSEVLLTLCSIADMGGSSQTGIHSCSAFAYCTQNFCCHALVVVICVTSDMHVT